MTNGIVITWNKAIAICSVFLFPSLSLIIGIAVYATKFSDKVENFGIKQAEQGIYLKELNDKVDKLSVRVDTIASRQKSNQQENNYRFLLLDHEKRK